MKFSFSLSTRKKLRAYSGSQITALLVILIIVNILVHPLTFRVDLTDQKLFTLAPETKKLVRNLDDTVTISAFFSQNLPPELLTVRQQLTDLLGEYTSLSDRVHLTVRDPKSDEAAAREAQDLQIPEIQFNLFQQDQFQVTTGYLGIALQYHDKTETLPFIQDASNTEYDLTAALLKITRSSTPTIAFTSGHNETDTASLENILGKNYTVTTVDLTDGKFIDSSISTLVLAGPKLAFDDRSKFILDQFMMRGGKIIFFLDGVDVDNNLFGQKNKSDLFPLLSHYGVNEKQNIVFDALSHETLNFQSGLFSVLQPYPFWPRIIKDFINHDQPLTRALETAVLGWASSLESAQDAQGTSFTPLLSSTNGSWTVDSEPFSLAPNAFPADNPNKQSFVLAGSVQGNFSSFFKDKDKPAGPNGIQDPNFIDHVDNNSFIVVADSDMISEQTLQKYPENVVFAANAVDSLTQDESLISIRSRTASNRPLQPLSVSQKSLVKYGNIFGSVLLAVGIGLFTSWYRKHRGKKFKENL